MDQENNIGLHLAIGKAWFSNSLSKKTANEWVKKLGHI
jgi:hypothetical protein